MQPNLKIASVATETLVPFAANARTHSDEQVAQIAKSIREFGFVNPVLVDADNSIIAGHGRVLAAKALQLATVPVIRLKHLSEPQARALRLADNKIALNAGWDTDLLRAELSALSTFGVDLSLTGFAPLELTDYLAERTVGQTDPDDVPETPKHATVRLGETWLLGRHRITCGDSTDAAVARQAMADAKPNLMVTDPPYGVEYDPAWRVRAGVGGKGRAVGVVANDDRADWRDTWKHFPGNVAYVWHGGLQAAIVVDSLTTAGFASRAQIIWVKTRPVFSRGAYHWQHETASFVIRPEDPPEPMFEPEHAAAYYAVREKERADWQGGRKQSTVWFIEHTKSDTGHGTQKPVECMRRPIENNSAPGSWVYEPFSGSGTTIIAAEMTGRRCAAIELMPHYVDVAILRWQAFTGKAATLEGTELTFDTAQRERQEPTADA